MNIGELARRSGTSARSLRYYEAQGLLSPERSANGYRVYTPQALDTVRQIRGLLGTGFPTEVIRDVLPCLSGTGDIYLRQLSPDTHTRLCGEVRRLEAQIECLTRNRDAIAAYLAAVPLRPPASLPGPS